MEEPNCSKIFNHYYHRSLTQSPETYQSDQTRTKDNTMLLIVAGSRLYKHLSQHQGSHHHLRRHLKPGQDKYKQGTRERRRIKPSSCIADTNEDGEDGAGNKNPVIVAFFWMSFLAFHQLQFSSCHVLSLRLLTKPSS